MKALQDLLLEEKVTISLSPSQDRQLYGLANEDSPDPNAVVVHPWEQDFVPKDDIWDTIVETTTENLWEEESVRKPAVPVLTCPVHFISCKKGICKEMAKLVREQERKAAADAKQQSNCHGRGMLANFTFW